jgi:NADPH:quinone reductase-like Zn-dependent oxidoreductase
VETDTPVARLTSLIVVRELTLKTFYGGLKRFYTRWPLVSTAGLKPDSASLGLDLAGVVEAVGGQVTDFRPGDDVFGAGTGSFAELAIVGATGAISAKPPT